MKISKFTAVFISLIIFSLNSFGSVRCQELFSPIERLRNIKFGDKHEELVVQIEKVKNGKNIKGIVFNDRQSSIEDQGELGVCHLYSFASQLSNHLKKNHELTEESELAPQYWTYHHYLKRAKELLKTDADKNLNVPLGSHFGASAELIREIGAVTKQAWREIGGKENNLSGPEVALVQAQLEKIIIESKSTEIIIKELLKPIEISSTMSSAEKLKLLKNRMLSATAVQQSSLVTQVLSRLKSENSPLFQDKQIWRLLTQAAKGVSLGSQMTAELYKKIDVLLSKNSTNKIEKLLGLFFFKTPESVSFANMAIRMGGKVYTSPNDFAKNELPLLDFPTVALIPDRNFKNQSADKDVYVPRFPKKIASIGLRTSNETFEQEVMEKIDSGENVWIGYEHNNLVVDKSGMMAMEYKTTYPFSAVKNRLEREVVNYSDGLHALQIVGYVKNPVTNELVLWIIKNSWGEQAGNIGYYYMYQSYARNYMRYAAFFDGSEPAQKLYEAANKKPKVKLP